MPHGAQEYLVDNSAYNLRRKRIVAERLAPLLERGLIFTCAVIELEAGRAVRGGDYDSAMRHRTGSGALIDVTMPDDVWFRALQIQADLAGRSQNQGPSVVDLVVAAVAERHGLTVLHYDSDFDTIATATSVSCEWVVPRGEADGPDDL